MIVNFGSFSNEGEFSIGADAATLMPFFCLISALLIFFHLFEETLVLQVRVLGTVWGLTVESTKPSRQPWSTLSVRLRHLSESLVLHAVLSDWLKRQIQVLILMKLSTGLLTRWVWWSSFFREGTYLVIALSAPKVTWVHSCIGTRWIIGHLNFLTHLSYIDHPRLRAL